MKEIHYLAASGVTSASVWFWFGVVGLVVGVIGSLFPMWKSAKVSPDSLMRRSYWFGSAVFVVCIFLTQVPNWKNATFGACAFGLSLLSIAFFRSSHIKIGGRIIAALPSYRRPDRPPALSEQARD
ncbi:MAG: hypothetical protein WBB07_16480 [Mycobacterium sp.]